MSLNLGQLNAFITADDGQFLHTLDADTARMAAFSATTGVQLRGLEQEFGERGRGMGEQLGAAFEEALADLHPQLTMDADARPADERVAALFRRIEELRAHVGVDVPPEEALAEIQEIQDALQLLSQRHADPAVRVQTAHAATTLAAIQEMIGEVDRSDPEVTVDMDADRALTGLREVDAQARELGRNDGPSRLGDAFRVLVSSLGGVIGSLSGILGQGALMAGAFGAVVPVVAGLVAALVNIAPAAAVGATAVLSLASAAAAIKIGTGGIGDAFKAAFAPAVSAGGAAANTARQVADAQRALRDATQQAAVANYQAAEQTARAERNVADAQKAARQAQQDLNASREQATRDLQDMNESLKDSYVDQEQAVLDVKTAQEQLDADRKAGAKVSADQVRQDEINLERAQRRLEEQDITTKRLQEDTNKANKAGVDGSQTMINARQKVSDANRNLGDQEQALADQRAQQARTAAQGVESIQKATEALDAAMTKAGGGGGGVNKLGQALAKLSPNARAFVLQAIALRGAWTSLQQAVQDRLFAGLAGDLRTTAGVLLPIFRTNLVATAGVLNTMARSAAAAARDLGRSGVLGQALAYATQGLRNMAGVPALAVRAFGQLAAAAGPSFAQLTAAAAGTAGRIGASLNAAFASGRLQSAIQTAVGLIRELGQIAGNVFSILRSVLGAAQQSGAGFLGTLRTITAALAQAFASPAVQAGLTALYQTMGLIARTAGPLLIQALNLIAPILVALAPPVQTLVKVLGAALGPVLAALAPLLRILGTTLVPLITLAVQALAPVFTALTGPLGVVIQALGAGLRPIIVALGPVLLAAAQAVGSLLVALSPLLPIVGQMIAALGPVLTPILKIVGDLFTALAPVLLTLGRALLPPFAKLTSTLAGAFKQLEPVLGSALQQLGRGGLMPILTGLGTILGQIVTQYSAAFVNVFRQLLPVIPVLIPVLVQLGQSIGQILTAVAPLVPQLALMGVQFVSELLPAILPLIPPLAQLIVLLLKLATGVITKVVIPIVGALVTVMGGLRTALKPAVDAVTWVTKSIASAFSWLFDILLGHSIIPDIVTGAVRWFALLPLRAASALSGLAGSIYRQVAYALNVMLQAIQQGLSLSVQWVATLPGRALRALGNIGTVLYRSGQALLRGFVDGIKSMGSVVDNAVSGIVSSARDFFPFSPAKRGPFAGKGWTLYSGVAIGQALAGGLSSQEAAVAGAARSLAARAQDGLAVQGTALGALVAPPLPAGAGYAGARGNGPAGAPASARVVIDLVGADSAVVKAVRKRIRVSGGSAQVVLGQGGA